MIEKTNDCIKWGGDGRREGHENQYRFSNFMAVKKLLKQANLVPPEVASASNFYSKPVYVCNTNAMRTYVQ